MDVLQAAECAAAQLRSCRPQHRWPQHRESVLHAPAAAAGQPAAPPVINRRQKAAAQSDSCVWVRSCQALHPAGQLDGGKYVGCAPCQKHRLVDGRCVQRTPAAQQLGQPNEVRLGIDRSAPAKGLPVWLDTYRKRRRPPCMQSTLMMLLDMAKCKQRLD